MLSQTGAPPEVCKEMQDRIVRNYHELLATSAGHVPASPSDNFVAEVGRPSKKTQRSVSKPSAVKRTTGDDISEDEEEEGESSSSEDEEHGSRKNKKKRPALAPSDSRLVFNTAGDAAAHWVEMSQKVHIVLFHVPMGATNNVGAEPAFLGNDCVDGGLWRHIRTEEKTLTVTCSLLGMSLSKAVTMVRPPHHS